MKFLMNYGNILFGEGKGKNRVKYNHPAVADRAWTIRQN